MTPKDKRKTMQPAVLFLVPQRDCMMQRCGWRLCLRALPDGKGVKWKQKRSRSCEKLRVLIIPIPVVLPLRLDRLPQWL
jgi:hypothetical protein